ncbi:MAG: NUDIX domain-containing protein [Bacteroidales bacterium]
MKDTKNIAEVFKYCPRCGTNNLVVRSERELYCPNCRFNLFINASGAATAIIFNENKELLLCRRAREPFRGSYELPGGFLEFEETAEDAVKREVAEELNLKINKLSYFGTYTNKYPFGGLIVNTIDIVYLCEVTDFSCLEVDDDVDKVKFVPLHKIDMKEISSQAMRDILAKLMDAR